MSVSDSDLLLVSRENNFASAALRPVVVTVKKVRLVRIVFALLAVIAAGFLTTPVSAQLSKGHQILINRGLQIQALAQDDCYFHLDTMTNANYTGVQWVNGFVYDTNNNIIAVHASRPDWMGNPPGLPWGRWAIDETNVPPTMTSYGGDETPFMSQLIAMILGDEWALNDTGPRDRLVNWFNSIRTNWPNTLLFHNSYGSQVNDAALGDFYTRAQPDMLSFDTYPWQSVYDTNQPNHTGPAIPGPPSGWYGDLRRYREHARTAGIPLALYRQTFHAVQDYDAHVFRDPSAAELRLLTFAGLAFNAKFFIDFTYNTGANSIFTNSINGNYVGYAGDSTTNANGLYAEVKDMNKRALNFGKALVRLTGITTEGIPGFTTSIMFIRGKDSGGNLTYIPVGFLGDQDSGGGNAGYTDWVYQRNDPYLRGWAVTNKAQIKNNGNPGDVIISWFKPLDESFDGPDYNNETYMMVVNGLTDPTGTPADCAQEISLNFDSSLTAIEMLDPLTGVASVQTLTLTNGVRRLTLNLNGGDGVLFKFADGAPFVGVQSTPVTGAPQITIHPTDRNAPLYGSATLFGRALGSGPLSYQWQKNGVNIPGATTNNYSVTNAQFRDAGTYALVVSNAVGIATSASAVLTVGPQPFLYEPFSYSNFGSPLSSNTPSIWAYGGSGTNDCQVTAGSLNYLGLASSGNSITNGGVGLGVRRLFDRAIGSGVLYFSVLFKMTDQSGGWTAGNMPAQIAALLTPNNSTLRLQVMVKSNTPSTYLFGLQKGGAGASIVMDTIPHSLGETILLVGKYDFTVTPNPVTLWINPNVAYTYPSEPSTGFLTVSTGLDFNGTNYIDRFNFRQNTVQSVPTAMQWDELRVGTQWSEVTPLPPSLPVSLSSAGVTVTNGAVQFSYSGSAAQTANLYVSTNLIDWIRLGNPTEISPGVYQCTDLNATNTSRFYQLRWP